MLHMITQTVDFLVKSSGANTRAYKRLSVKQKYHEQDLNPGPLV